MTQEKKAPRLFGTNGVRGIVNSGEMDPMFAMKLGMAIGSFLKGKVMIGTDARTSNEMLKSACVSGLMAVGCDVSDCGVVPTPTLQYAVKVAKAAGGVVITASHNPPEFNGIKAIDADGTEMSREDEESIERIYYEDAFARADWRRIGQTTQNLTAVDRYIGGILSKVDVPTIRKANLRIAVDCGNGASSLVTPKLLERLGVRYVTLNADPNGAFPGHDSEPVPENAVDLVKLVQSGGFDFGVIHDGDGDRTIFVDDTGRYLHGDRSLAIVANYICSQKPNRLVVTNVASSQCIEDAVKMAGGRMLYTRVGSPTIARAMMREGGVFGGEENGGLIFAEFQFCRDGAMAVAKMLEIVAKTGKLSKLNDRIPAYCQCKKKTRCPEGKKQAVLKEIAEDAKGLKVDTTDGIKILFDEGWVIIRPSGTEPIFRVFSESKSASRAEELADKYKKKVEKFVKG
ncbi:MAG: phosphoglucosamine mutase [Euryarchaeota archaeon RBG_13_57_23]|nr:MAG: phosphoglucosamine mutase [Euryarchaeota archaeon RBG_13_57_23]